MFIYIYIYTYKYVYMYIYECTDLFICIYVGIYADIY